MSEAERQRLIEAEWVSEGVSESAEFTTEINVYAYGQKRTYIRPD